MKKFLSILVVLTVLVMGVNAKEIEKPTSSAGVAVIKSETGFKLFYQGSKRGDIKVTIYNASGEVVHKETLHKTESFARPYNLESLKEGEYTVEVRDADGTQLKKVNYSHKKVQLLAKLTPIPGESDKYVLTVSKKSGVNRINVRIYNDNGEVVYDGSENVVNDFGKVYNLAKVSKKFSFEVSDNRGNSQRLSN